MWCKQGRFHINSENIQNVVCRLKLNWSLVVIFGLFFLDSRLTDPKLSQTKVSLHMMPWTTSIFPSTVSAELPPNEDHAEIPKLEPNPEPFGVCWADMLKFVGEMHKL